ncbi:hypothetical protein [Candidatus Nitrosocosmicus franklandus]|uniref:Uncharacterized protein n=1 Tax=Candidatus Nitrosocosmicus franklandianus TaxID=1798806 RepID=A0A484I673_9ARCH|nr:hypothetical protein [Candidatus Nitrosocosmicus franklandus]VFJ13198.1 conserved protein of unknown function [Candidatus Nitrosocosmicus franklandus]
MDFANRPFQHRNVDNFIYDNHLNQIPKRNLTELELLNNQIFDSMRVRMQNLSTGNDHQDFKRLVDQTLGRDISNLNNLTKEFIETRRAKF